MINYFYFIFLSLLQPKKEMHRQIFLHSSTIHYCQFRLYFCSSIWFSSNGHGIYRGRSQCSRTFHNLYFRAAIWSKKIHALFGWFDVSLTFIYYTFGPFSRWPSYWVYWKFTSLWMDCSNCNSGLSNWTSNWSWTFFMAVLWWVVIGNLELMREVSKTLTNT